MMCNENVFATVNVDDDGNEFLTSKTIGSHEYIFIESYKQNITNKHVTVFYCRYCLEKHVVMEG